MGQGFNIHSNSDNAILVAGGIGVAPLLALADLIRGEYPHINLVVLLGARKREELLCERDFRDTGAEVIPVTDDGSWGRKALVTEILEDILRERGERKPDKKRSVIYSCGPKEMLREVSRLSMEYGLPCQISLEEMMACGVGACLGCVVAVQSSVKETFASNKTQGKKVSFKGESPKYKRVCVEGPVFSAEEVILSTTPTTRVGA